MSRFGQHRTGIEDFHPLAPHQIGKNIMILARLFDPYHIIEQQIFAI
tara:strand:+ start:449 stop:589 length:141 start_codon:yes stop_codon:yes gene_type:complete